MCVKGDRRAGYAGGRGLTAGCRSDGGWRWGQSYAYTAILEAFVNWLELGSLDRVMQELLEGCAGWLNEDMDSEEDVLIKLRAVASGRYAICGKVKGVRDQSGPTPEW